MEDLGHIDINIRDMGGGGGGGGRGSGGGSGGNGGPGGGPALPSNALSLYGPAGAAQGNYQQQTASNIAGMRQNLKGWMAGITAMQGSRAFMGAESIVELRDFFRNPTLSGFKLLTSNASATGTMLQKLAASSPRLAIWAMNLLGAAGAAASFVTVMKHAAEAIKERTLDLAKYSSALSLGVAREQMAQMSRDFKELHENGKMYAEAQRMDTWAADQWADAMIYVRQVMVGLGNTFNLLKVGLGYILKGIALPVSLPMRLGKLFEERYSLGFAAFRANFFNNLLTEFKGIRLASQMLPGFGIFGGLGDWLQGLLEKMSTDVSKIKANTTKADLAGEINDWFRADVMAMTGRAY